MADRPVYKLKCSSSRHPRAIYYRDVAKAQRFMEAHARSYPGHATTIVRGRKLVMTYEPPLDTAQG